MSSAAYVMGHNDRERRRLALQATILAPLTTQFLARAGIGEGMTVLDLGCGVGDVTLIAAQLVGPSGRVIAVDMDEAALAVAEARARADGFGNVSFVSAKIDEYRPEGAHAVVGRHILIHAPDPLATLRHARGILHEGGVAAFQEFDFSYFPPPFPPFALRERVCAVFTDFFGRLGRGDTGGRLYHLFTEAGFAAPDCRGEFSIHGGEDSPWHEWIAESLRSVLPRAQALGIGLEFVDTIDTLAERLREEAAARRSSLPAPVMVGAFARKS
jgi:SAM-dependent methyltransferase